MSVPNDVDPHHYSGRAGTRNYEGSVAWYRTRFQAQSAGEYALDFQSANFQATVWVDGRPLGTHRGSYLPFELRTHVGAGAHTVVVRIDWRHPGAQSRSGFHRTWFNWGGLNGEVDVRPIGASELESPALQSTIQADGSVRVSVSVQVRNYGPVRTLQPEGTLVRGSHTVPLAFAPVTLAHGASASEKTDLFAGTASGFYRLST